MNEDLTDYEKKLLSQMEHAGRRDGLMHELTTGIPCVLIIGLSIYFEAWIGVVVGVVTYGVIRLWVVIQQDAMVPHISSAIKKLRKER